MATVENETVSIPDTGFEAASQDLASQDLNGSPINGLVIPGGSPGGAPPSEPGMHGGEAVPVAASASLYVGDLHPDVTEATLGDIFSDVGPVSSVRVCRDVVTRRSLGYGYVNFHNVVDAERALDTMNYYSSAATYDRPMRLMWKHRDPSTRKVGAGNLFIKNLAKTIDNKSLYDTFSAFGNIMSCKVALDEQGQSKGYGFVHFENDEAADAACKCINGKIVEGKKVYVGPFHSKKEREASGEINRIFTNVYVKNLDPDSCTDEKIRELFGDFGDITSIFCPNDEEGKPKGFAFVNFETPEGANRAVEEMDGKEIAGKNLYVGRAQKKAERESDLKQKFENLRNERIQKYQGVNLYVKNLSDEIDDECLRNEFGQYGTITSCRVMSDEKGNSKGFGFVCFSEPEEATKAVTELNGKIVGQKPIYVALAQRKDVRRAQLEAQRQANLRGMGVPAPGAPMYTQPGMPMFYGQGMPGPHMQVPGGRGQPQFMNPQYMGMNRNMVGMGGRGGPMPQGAMPGYGNPNAMPRQGMPMGYGVMGPGRPTRGGRGANMGSNAGRPGGPMQGGRGGRGGAAGGQQQFKYTMNARNAGTVGGAQPDIPNQANANQEAQVTQDPSNQDLTLEMLANASPEQQKRMLGERLYPMIYEKHPQLAGKITGMLLEMDNSEILHLLESPDSFAEKVDEALQVLASVQQPDQQ